MKIQSTQHFKRFITGNRMTEELIERINQWNDIKYPNNKETRIIICTLKPETKGTVTTAPK